jgi:hypothetical protein
MQAQVWLERYKKSIGFLCLLLLTGAFFPFARMVKAATFADVLNVLMPFLSGLLLVSLFLMLFLSMKDSLILSGVHLGILLFMFYAVEWMSVDANLLSFYLIVMIASTTPLILAVWILPKESAYILRVLLFSTLVMLMLLITGLYPLFSAFQWVNIILAQWLAYFITNLLRSYKQTPTAFRAQRLMYKMIEGLEQRAYPKRMKLVVVTYLLILIAAILAAWMMLVETSWLVIGLLMFLILLTIFSNLRATLSYYVMILSVLVVIPLLTGLEQVIINYTSDLFALTDEHIVSIILLLWAIGINSLVFFFSNKFRLYYPVLAACFLLWLIPYASEIHMPDFEIGFTIYLIIGYSVVHILFFLCAPAIQQQLLVHYKRAYRPYEVNVELVKSIDEGAPIPHIPSDRRELLLTRKYGHWLLRKERELQENFYQKND